MKTYTRFHAGEVQVQAQAGTDTDRYEEMSVPMMVPDLKPNEAAFVEGLTYSFAGSVDAEGRPWASPLFSNGAPLFVVRTPTHVEISSARSAGDPLVANLEQTGELSVLYFEPSTRRRSKSIGQGSVRVDGTIDYEMTRNFGLCPKYIFKRTHEPAHAAVAQPAATVRGSSLGDGDMDQLRMSDTIFFASHSPHGADVTHRGGNPGFVQVVDSQTVVIPDYFGNGMFNTFGNLVLDDRLAITDVDLATGRTIHMTGRAEVQTAELAPDDVQRQVVFTLDEFVVSHASAGSWTDVEASRYSPA